MSNLSEYVSKAARAAGYEIDGPRSAGQKALAAATGLSVATIGRTLAGISVPQPGALIRIAEAVNVPPNDLLAQVGLSMEEIQQRRTMQPISSDLVEKIRRLRRMQRVSTEELARRITAQGYRRTGRSVIANYEGKRSESIPVDYLVHAATALGTTAEALLTQPVECPACKGTPPEGFTCNTCGGAA